jgi:hypothetical protein
MADQAVLHIGENSPEQVAYKLMLDVARIEKRALHGDASSGYTPADRKWLLQTFMECHYAVRNVRMSDGLK